MVTCHDGVELLSEGHQTMYDGPPGGIKILCITFIIKVLREREKSVVLHIIHEDILIIQGHSHRMHTFCIYASNSIQRQNFNFLYEFSWKWETTYITHISSYTLHMLVCFVTHNTHQDQEVQCVNPVKPFVDRLRGDRWVLWQSTDLLPGKASC